MAKIDPDHMTAQQILDVVAAVRRAEPEAPSEGLRERKKRRLRQLISDIATAHFIAEGFENVTVAQIAAACDVSEQTVYNYFPTKEEMFFDRSAELTEALADAVRVNDGRPLAEVLAGQMREAVPSTRWEGIDEHLTLALLRRFLATIAESPVLTAAQNRDFVQLIHTLEGALAERIHASPQDPEVTMGAVTIAGLVYTMLLMRANRLAAASSLAEVEEGIGADIDRAIRAVAPVLATFDQPVRQRKARAPRRA